MRPIRRRVAPSINIAPLIDMIFLLLIFFVVTSTLSAQLNQLELTPPASETAGAGQAEALQVMIDRHHQILFEEQIVDLAGLTAALKAHNPQDLSVAVLADQEIPISLVLEVLDAIRLAGIEDVAIEAQAKGGE